jgi:hypothetical protein
VIDSHHFATSSKRAAQQSSIACIDACQQRKKDSHAMANERAATVRHFAAIGRR